MVSISAERADWATRVFAVVRFLSALLVLGISVYLVTIPKNVLANGFNRVFGTVIVSSVEIILSMFCLWRRGKWFLLLTSLVATYFFIAVFLIPSFNKCADYVDAATNYNPKACKVWIYLGVMTGFQAFLAIMWLIFAWMTRNVRDGRAYLKPQKPKPVDSSQNYHPGPNQEQSNFQGTSAYVPTQYPRYAADEAQYHQSQQPQHLPRY